MRVSTLLNLEDIASTPQGIRLSPEVALGLVAFNSPYLFGGKALRSELTCAACHSKEGPSGSALRLRLRAPAPDLHAAGDRINVSAFVSHAVVTEFDGPPLSQRTSHALAALTRVLAPYSAGPTQIYRVDGPALVSIGLRLLLMDAHSANRQADDLNFLIDSLRFVLGEMARDAQLGKQTTLLAETNRALHDAIPALDAANSNFRFEPLQALGHRWDEQLIQPRFVISGN